MTVANQNLTNVLSENFDSVPGCKILLDFLREKSIFHISGDLTGYLLRSINVLKNSLANDSEPGSFGPGFCL